MQHGTPHEQPTPKRTQAGPPSRKETPSQTTKTNRPAKANPAGTKRVGRQGRPAKRDRGTRRRRRGGGKPTPPSPRTYTHPTAARRATAWREQGPPWSQTGPPERGSFPAPAQQHARARSARHIQAGQGTHAAPHASTHHGTKHDSTTANTHTRRRTSRQEQVQARQTPQRNSRRPDGRVCARQGTKPLPATKQPNTEDSKERKIHDTPDWSIRGGVELGPSPRTGSSGGEPGATDWSVRGNGENTTKRRPGLEHPGRNEARH